MSPKNKKKALELIKQKKGGDLTITYTEIANLTGYSRKQINRFLNDLNDKDDDIILSHGLKNRSSNNSASKQEIDYIVKFKNQYPKVSISQFMDIYHEDVIWNPLLKEDVAKYGLKKRSKSFFQQLYKKEKWISPIKHKCFNGTKDIHPLREPSPRRGTLVMTDGTPHDWFENGQKFSLHTLIDDATDELLAGWFAPTECQFGYCMAFKIMFQKHGIPQIIYADRTTILWDPKEGCKTQVARMLEELGIELIFANSPEAKGKIEKMNNTLQNRLLVDIQRYKIKTYPELNKWFNDFYIDYINKKFAYEPKENETEFVPLGNTDLTKIFCIKVERTILNGNMISYKNCYYIPINNDGSDHVFFKGTKVEVWQDVFDTTFIRIYKDKKVYKTRLIEGHKVDPEKREQKRIQDQKQLELVLKERDERQKAMKSK